MREMRKINKRTRAHTPVVGVHALENLDRVHAALECADGVLHQLERAVVLLQLQKSVYVRVCVCFGGRGEEGGGGG